MTSPNSGFDAQDPNNSQNQGFNSPNPGFNSPNPGYGAPGQGGFTPVGGFDVEKIKKNALIATIVGFLCGGLLPGILGLLGYLKADQEPATAKKFTKWSWIAFAIMWAISIILIIVYVIFMIAVVGSSTTTY